MSQTIAELVQDCLGLFKHLLEDEQLAHAEELEDALSRFRVWTGNVAAHRPHGRRSLQYRLRDSSELLTVVQSSLKDLLGLLRSIPLHRLGSAKESITTSPAANEDDDDTFADADLDDNATQDPELFLVREANDVITGLLRLSMTLRNPARDDQIRYADTTSTKHFEPHDIEHVRMKYPEAAQWLAERFGKAISRHRQYFKYREEHHEKLREGLYADDLGARPSTVATSVKHENNAPQIPAAGFDAESVYTATSYALTLAHESTLRPPPRPPTDDQDTPFECPLCYTIVTATDERSWRQHVYEDLPPYLCTHKECAIGNRHFSRRRDWHHHMKSHDRHWLCPLGCGDRFLSKAELLEHAGQQHDQTLSETSLRMAMHANDSDPTAGLHIQQCPFCPETRSMNNFIKHVGHHMEQLALFALPQSAFGESDDEDRSGEVLDKDVISSEDEMDEKAAAAFIKDTSLMINQFEIAFPHEPEESARLKSILISFQGGSKSRDALQKAISARSALLPNFVKDLSKNLPALPPALDDGPSPPPSNALELERVGTGEPESTEAPSDYIVQSDDDSDGIVGPAQGPKPRVQRSATETDIYEENSSKDGRYTIVPKHLVRRQAIIDSGYLFIEEEESYLVRGTLSEYQINEIKQISLKFRQTEQATSVSSVPPIDGAQVSSYPHENVPDFRRPGVVVDSAPPETGQTEDLAPSAIEVVEYLSDSDGGRGRRARDKGKYRRTTTPTEAYSSTRTSSAASIDAHRGQQEADWNDHWNRNPERQERSNSLDHTHSPTFSALGAAALAGLYENQLRQAKMRRDEQGLVQRQEVQPQEVQPQGMKPRDQGSLPLAWEESRRVALDDTAKSMDFVSDERTKKSGQKVELEFDRVRQEVQGPGAPIYPKIHRDYLAVETLRYYSLPWEYDKSNPEYIIIFRDMDKRETDILFDHTMRLRSRSLLGAQTKPT